MYFAWSDKGFDAMYYMHKICKGAIRNFLRDDKWMMHNIVCMYAWEI